ncbi:THO complex subunit 6 homolog [Gigantopelta aegis]|uniref:THO complex subunit 6 homolog n=1 Tax=Gigantopelta aegis TaxID=1735272 RepID=UPI001B887B77|nr:THO complex subunit 6 homolog [Gigantopelta aegis]
MTQDRCQQVRQLLHTTIFAQSYSPCGKFLAAANNYGQIAVFSLAVALSPEACTESCLPVFVFKANESGSIYSLISTDTLLLSAGEGEISAWKWADILGKAPKVEWSLTIPKKDVFSNPEVNSLVIENSEQGTSRLFAGCGDNNVHIWNLESGTLESTLTGHEDYVHCVCLKNHGRECVSASEDGTCRIWDTRASLEAIHILEPYKSEMCCRPQLGKWLACVDMDSSEDWLVCGGGPHLSMWHMRSLSATTAFKTSGATHSFAMFYDDHVISGGSRPYVNHWFVNGDLKSEVPCTPATVFNIDVNHKSDKYKVLTVVGSSSKIDVCTNFGYRAFSLNFKPF